MADTTSDPNAPTTRPDNAKAIALAGAAFIDQLTLATCNTSLGVANIVKAGLTQPSPQPAAPPPEQS